MVPVAGWNVSCTVCQDLLISVKAHESLAMVKQMLMVMLNEKIPEIPLGSPAKLYRRRFILWDQLISDAEGHTPSGSICVRFSFFISPYGLTRICFIVLHCTRAKRSMPLTIWSWSLGMKPRRKENMMIKIQISWPGLRLFCLFTNTATIRSTRFARPCKNFGPAHGRLICLPCVCFWLKLHPNKATMFQNMIWAILTCFAYCCLLLWVVCIRNAFETQ